MSEVLISFFVAQKLLLKWIISQVPIWKLEKSSASESASKRVSAGGPPFEARFAILSSSLKPLPLSKSPNKEREEPVSQVKWNLDALDAPLETKKWKVFRMTMFRFKTWRSLRQKCDRHRHRRQQRRRQRWTRSATFCHFRSNENNEFVLSTFFCIEPKHRNRMLRFFSRRKSKHRIDGSDYTRSKDGESLSRKNQKYRPNKNVIVCKIILLDGNDLSIDVPVSPSAGVWCPFESREGCVKRKKA